MNILIGYLLSVPAVVIAITLHEYTKAQVSTWQGDLLPKQKGRLTFNPIKNMEPIGFLCMLVWSFGWGHPVQTSATYYKDRKWGTVLTYVAPSVVNIIVGYMFAALSVIYIRFTVGDGSEVVSNFNNYVIVMMTQIAAFNVKLALFNIIPIYPMDGSKVLGVFLSPNNVIKMAQYEKMLQLLLVILIFSGVIGAIINPIAKLMLFFLLT